MSRYTSTPSPATTLRGVAVEKDLENLPFCPYMAGCGAVLCDHRAVLGVVIGVGLVVAAPLICDPHMGVVISGEYDGNLTVITALCTLILPPYVGFTGDFGRF